MPRRLLLAILALSALLFLVSFLFPSSGRKPVFSWAPGYWQILPKIGLARIVPVASPSLVSPAAGAGPKAALEPAEIRPLKKY